MKELHYIMAAPWTGMNHLANIVGTAQEFRNSLNPETVLEFYKNNDEQKFHFYNKMHLDRLKAVADMPEGRYLLYGHFADFVSVYDLIKDKLKKVIVLEFPYDQGTKAFQRVKQNAEIKEYYLGEQYILYKLDTMKKLIDCEIEDLPIDFFHNIEPMQMFDKIDNFFNIKINRLIALKLHPIWLRKAFRE